MYVVNGGKPAPLRPAVWISLFLSFMMAGHFGLRAEADKPNGVLRSRAYKLSHITSQQAREMLSQLNIGTGYDLLSDQVLIVTSKQGTDLIKATEVIRVLDQTEPVAVWPLLVAGEQQPLPNVEVLTAQMHNLSVGSMTDAPAKGAKNPVIIDVLGNRIIAIGSEALLPEVQKHVEAWKAAHPPVPTRAADTAPEPAEPAAMPGVMGQPQESPTRSVEQRLEPDAERQADEAPVIEEALSLQKMVSRLLEEEEPPAGASETELVPMEHAEPGDEDLMEMLETESNTTEDYISDELLRVLLDEEKKAQPPKPVVPETPAEPEVAAQPPAQPQKQAEEPETAVVTEPSQRGEQKTLEEAIKMLLGQEQAPPQEPDIARTEPDMTPEEAAAAARPEVVSENLRLQRELAILRDQLARQDQTGTDAAGTVELDQPQEEQIEPTIITRQDPTLTQFKEAIGEQELETVIDLPQQVELENLVDLVGKQLGLNYMYDPAIFRNQNVFLKIHEGRIKVKDLYGLLESVLRFRGFVMTRRDDLVTIIKASDVNQVYAQTDTVIRMPGDPIQPGDIIVSTIFQLENIGSASARKVLTEMKLGLTNGFQEIPETNTLIVTDYAYRMPRIEEVLEMIDIAGEEKIFKFRALKYMQAAELVEKLKALVAEMEGVSMQVGDAAPAAAAPTRYTTQRRRNPQTGRIETVRVPVEQSPAAGGAAGAAAAGEQTVFIDTDERTNRVLMIGTEGQIDIINQLVDTLDVPQYDLKFVREYVIQYVEAIEVVNVLNELGLASLSVSGDAGQTAARSAAAQRAAAARRQPQQPQAEPAAASAPTVTGDAAQPNVSIRPATNSLLVNGTEEQHQAIELVIAHVDVVQKDQRTIREYEIQFVDTQEIINTMTDLGVISQSTGAASTQQGGRTSAGRTSRAAQPPQPATAEGGPVAGLQGFAGADGAGEDITAQQPQISVLEATNSLLVFATPRQHKAIQLIIAHADRVPETTTTPYVVYALENQDPLELAEVLTKLVQETVEEVGKTTTPESRIQTTGGGAAGGGGVPNLEEQKIRIIPDTMSYSLIVYANKRNQQWISELIAELDEYRPQVLLDCTLVEVTKDDQFKYELDLVSKTYSDLDLRPGTTGSLGGTATSIGTLGGSGSFSVDRYAHGSSNSGTFTGFFNSDMIQALLTAMQKNEYGRVMARPKILVNDNQEGEIKTEDIQAVAQITTNVVPGTATQTSTTTQSASFTDYTAGVTLRIKPHISKGDMLRLEITLNRTDFGTTARTIEIADGTGESTTPVPYPPDRTTTDITTVSTIPDGTTIILGGLEKIKQGKLQSKVPILGDIPIIGGLFRDVSDTDTQGKLYVFVKANILRPGDQVGGLQDIRRVSGKYRKEFEEMEDDFQKMQDWPGIDPEPMDPVKVLDEDEIIEITEP